MQNPVSAAQEVLPCDVLVIGGGPAGSTAAALLAASGKDVVLLEKEAHPRFHIGESLLPRNMEIIDRLGLRAQVAGIGVYKPGAEFVSDSTGQSVAFDFSLAIGRRDAGAYQVVRSEFDALLFNEARSRGARAAERTCVTDLQPEDAKGRLRVTAVDEDTGEQRCFAPRFVLDASGRDTFIANRAKSKRANKNNNTAAVFAHYRGVERRSGDLEGYISVHLAEDGWFWMIPLRDEIMSVGFVGMPCAFKSRRGTMDDFLAARIAMSDTVRARMMNAERISSVHSTGNYSYHSKSCWGERYMMIGDAFAFIDPVFSSGVLLAMTSAEKGAEVASAWLEDPARARALAKAFERETRLSMSRISWLIYRINHPVLRHLFMSPSNKFRMRDGVIALLSGNLRSDPSLRIPVIAFKSVYYVMAMAARLGLTRSLQSPRLAQV